MIQDIDEKIKHLILSSFVDDTRKFEHVFFGKDKELMSNQTISPTQISKLKQKDQ